MAVTYDSARGNITEKESSALMQIVPHLSSALNISTTFSILRARYQAALAAIERIKIGILLLDEHRNIILDNKAARKLTDFGSVFFVARGKLKIRAEQSSNELSALITSAATTASGNGRAQGGTIMVTSPDTHKQYILDVSPLRDSTNELGDHFHGALVSIIDPDYSEQLDVSCLKNIYSLTTAELETLQYVVQGLSNKDITDRRSVSPDTTKQQVSTVLNKVQVSGRTQLTRKVLSVVLPLEL